MEEYGDEKVEISAILQMSFPVAKMVDQFVADVYDIKIDTKKQSKSDVYQILYVKNGIASIEKPGIASFIDTFIRVLIKAIGSFAQNVIILCEFVRDIKKALLNPTAPANVKFLKDIIVKIKALIEEVNKFLTDTAGWITEKLLGAFAKISIPIPAFDFNILGFVLSFPKIDKIGALDSDNSPFKIPKIESSLLADINKKILDLFAKQKENTTNITNYNKQISDANAELDKLKLDTSIDNTLKIADLNKLIADLTAKLQLAINIDFDKLLADAKAELQQLLPQAPVSAYTEKIKTAITTIITFPITFIMSLFKQMLAALTGLITFDFSEFTKFIEMMKPSIDSVTLFISTFMDTFVSGFSKLYKAAKSKFGDLRNNMPDVMKYLQEFGLNILGKPETPENKTELNKTLSFLKVALNIILAFPPLFIELIIEIFNYALSPIEIKLSY